MKLVFIDEMGDSKQKQYLGICIAILDSTKYSAVKNSFNKIISDSGWDNNIEFKGSYIFSANKGDPNVGINERIDIVKEILSSTNSKKIRRFQFAYFGCNLGNNREIYLKYLPLLLDKFLKKAPKGAGKNLVAIYCDYRPDINSKDIEKEIKKILKKKNYILLENVNFSKSNMETIGILYADIVGYLYARIQTIGNDSELFESVPLEELQNNGKFKKLKTSIDLISCVKKIEVYEPKLTEKK